MNRFIVIDLETTGNHPDVDHITEVGAVLIEDNQIKRVYSSFVYTKNEIPIYIQKLTGITPDKVANAPKIEEVMADLLPMLEGSIFVAHNAAFDLSFIQHVLDNLGYKRFSGLVVDTLDLSRILLPMVQSYKLTNITEELDILHDNPHRAEDDAKATAELLIQLINQLNKMPLIYLQKVQEILKFTHPDLNRMIDEVIQKRIASYSEDDEDYLFFNQLALQPFQEVEEEENEKLHEIQQFESMFDEEGLLFYEFPEFELRPAQKKMSKAVWEAFINHEHIMVEAGTGTGKSLAYLIPSIFWAKEKDEKVVIATHTINLQEQLFQRDIPLLKKILPFSFSATILKGRNNYLCLRKFEQLLNTYNHIETNKEYAVDLSQILTWVTTTNTGDVEEINLSMTGRNIWSQIKSDADSCLNRYCPWFRTCFYHRARNKAQTSEIIITNHSLVLTNLKADHRILPGYNRLVIDEAHQFEEIASKHLGIELNQYQFQYLLHRFYKDAKNGFLIKMINELIQSQDLDQVNIANKIQNNLIPLVTAIEANMYQYFNMLSEFVDKRVRNNELGRKTLRITDKITLHENWKTIQDVSENIYVDLAELINLMEEVHHKLRNLEIEESLSVDFNGHFKDLKELIFIFSKWNRANDADMVFWVETVYRGRKFVSYLYASPIEIGPYIKEYLFDKLDSVVLTSATLSVNGSFHYASREFGFQPDDVELTKITLPSPFDYKNQSIVCIPSDFPNIQEVSEHQFIEQISKNIADVALTLNGRTLVLFTSHSMLQKTYELLKESLEPLQFKVLGHGIDSNSRTKLTKRFATEEQTVLLGTNSFWEGVDIPGEALSALIIVKLPFTPPNNPIHEAKTEILKEKGLNSFMEFSVPQAVIRFKQGFGRLIRTKRDKGVVIIYDKRVVESRYGKAFLKSLPPINVLYQPTSRIIQYIEDNFTN